MHEHLLGMLQHLLCIPFWNDTSFCVKSVVCSLLACRWVPDFPNFLKDTDQVLDTLLCEAKEEENRDGSLAREMQSAILVKLCTGAPMPQRPSSLTWIQGPGIDNQCEHPDCKDASCKGSRIIMDASGVQLIYLHHKTTRETGQHVVTFPADTPLAKALNEHCKWGWRTLRNRGTKRLFINNEGDGFKDDKGLTTFINDRCKEQTGLELKCRDYRTVAGTELNQLVSDPHVKEGLAHGMGTSTNMWRKTYAPNYKEIQIKKSIQESLQIIKEQQKTNERIELMLTQLNNGAGPSNTHQEPRQVTTPWRSPRLKEREEEDVIVIDMDDSDGDEA